MTGVNPKTGNRMVLLLIGGIPVTVILVATWMWFFMGKDMTRLRRFYISPQSAQDTLLSVPQLSDGQPAPEGSFAGYLANQHQGLQVLSLSADGFNTLFPEYAADKSSWYLIDPAGWIMMSYNRDVPYKDVITDLKFLLKNSGG